MNLHLIQDTVFLNDFADLLSEMEEIENNHFYVYYSESNDKNRHKYLIPEKFKNTKILDGSLEDLHKEASKYKNVFIHLLSDMLFEFVEKVDPKVNLIWCTWGSDFYGPDEIFTDMVFDKRSAAKFNEWNTEAILANVNKTSFSLNIKFPYRFIREEYHFAQRKKKVLEAYELSKQQYLDRKRKLLKKFVYHLNYGYEDHLWIKEFYQIDPKFGPLFYTMFDEVDDMIEPSSYLEKNGIKKEHKKIFIGNCATLHNNHLELIPILEKIKKKYPETKFIVPLSYGNKRYTEFISEAYKRSLGNNFFPIYNFIDKAEYYRILNSIDVMIMNHNVNQGGTNLFKAIYYGKTIFLKDKNPLGIHLRKNGVQLSDINSLDGKINDLFTPLSSDIVQANKKAINSIFSRSMAAKNMREALKGVN
jgi:hypothetical protein